MARTRKFKGDGSYRKVGTDKNGLDVYEVTVSAGFNPVTGRYEKRTRRVHGTMTDVMRVRDELNAEKNAGLVRDADKETFHEFATEWLKLREADGSLSKSTISINRRCLKVLFEHMGTWRLKDVKAASVDSVYGYIRDDYGYSGSTMKQVHITLNLVMKKAVEYGYITSNPIALVQKPKPGKSERRSLDQQQAARLSAGLREEWAEALGRFEAALYSGKVAGRRRIPDMRALSCVVAVRLIAATGMRRGEACGLSWGCVELGEGREALRVIASLTPDVELAEPKTSAGIRTIAIDGATADMLREWREVQRAALASLGIIQGTATPTCSCSTGAHLSPRELDRWWGTFRKSVGLDDWVLHELRHTQATLLLAEGVDVKTVAARLGHSSPSVTLNMYAHSMPEVDRNAAQAMGDILEGARDGKRVLKIA